MAPLYIDGDEPMGILCISRGVTEEVLPKQRLEDHERAI